MSLDNIGKQYKFNYSFEQYSEVATNGLTLRVVSLRTVYFIDISGFTEPSIPQVIQRRFWLFAIQGHLTNFTCPPMLLSNMDCVQLLRFFIDKPHETESMSKHNHLARFAELNQPLNGPLLPGLIE